MQFRKSIFMLFLIGFCVFLCSLFTVHAQASVQQHQGMDSLPIEGRYAVSASIGNDRLDYHVRNDSNSLVADNRGNGLTVRFKAGGIVIGSKTQNFSLRPVLWGYGVGETMLPEGIPQAVDNIVSNTRGVINEWYVNGPLGIQQGFTVTERPQAGMGPLTITMALDGVRAGCVEADGRGVMLTKLNGGTLYHYSGLAVRDAEGKEAYAWLQAKAEAIQICVDDVNLKYPLYIDPVIQEFKLSASDGTSYDVLGYSVAVSGDTVVVSAHGDDIGLNDDQGSAYIFVKPSGGWTENMIEAAKLTASDGSGGDGFGTSVAISGDTVVVGAHYDDIGSKLNQGSAYIFMKPPGGWAGNLTENAKLTASDGDSTDYFGESVAADNDTVVVGAPRNRYDKYPQAAYVFVKPESGWASMTQTAILTASDGAWTDSFGSSVAISGDTVVVGARFHNSSQGAAYVFVRPEDGWADMTQSTKLTACNGIAYFGRAVAVSGDTVVVGADHDNIGIKTAQGSAYVFVKPFSGWVETPTYNAKLIASDGNQDDYFGFSVAVSGETVVVGAWYADVGTNTTQGAAYWFVKPQVGWTDNITESAKLTASDGLANNLFGASVAVNGNTVVVGEPMDDLGSITNQGAAYVFVKTESGGETTSTTTTSVAPTTTTTISDNPACELKVIPSRVTMLLAGSPKSLELSSRLDVQGLDVRDILLLLRIVNYAIPLKFFVFIGDTNDSFACGDVPVWDSQCIQTLSGVRLTDRAMLALVYINPLTAEEGFYVVNVCDCTGRVELRKP